LFLTYTIFTKPPHVIIITCFCGGFNIKNIENPIIPRGFDVNKL